MAKVSACGSRQVFFPQLSLSHWLFNDISTAQRGDPLEPLKPPDRDAKDLEKSGGVWEAAKAIPGPTKDSASVKLVGTAEGAITAEPEALEPGVGSKDERDTTADRVAQVNMPVGEEGAQGRTCRGGHAGDGVQGRVRRGGRTGEGTQGRARQGGCAGEGVQGMLPHDSEVL